MLAPRINLMRELLSSQGSLYFHVGWAVSHYVKIMLDDVFGRDRFVNQIIWKRQTAHSDTLQGAQHYGRLHDVIFFYTKSPDFIWNMQYTPYDAKYLETHYKSIDADTGRRFEADNLTGPGGAGKGNPYFEFLGITRHWRYSKERMTRLPQEGG